jgi:hypothetical protein
MRFIATLDGSHPEFELEIPGAVSRLVGCRPQGTG